MASGDKLDGLSIGSRSWNKTQEKGQRMHSENFEMFIRKVRSGEKCFAWYEKKEKQ
jgi:hypothetical protein